MRELETRERRLLLFLGLIFLGFAVFRIGPWLVDSLRGGVDTGEATVGREGVGANDDIVQLARLDPDLRSYEVDRNPFVYGELPPPPPPPAPPPRPEPKPKPQRPKAEPKPVDTGPRLPEIRYTFVGSFGQRDRRIGVLADEEDGIHNVQEGDEVDGIVRVENIGFKTIALKYVDFPDQPAVTLELESR